MINNPYDTRSFSNWQLQPKKVDSHLLAKSRIAEISPVARNLPPSHSTEIATIFSDQAAKAIFVISRRPALSRQPLNPTTGIPYVSTETLPDVFQANTLTKLPPNELAEHTFNTNNLSFYKKRVKRLFGELPKEQFTTVPPREVYKSGDHKNPTLLSAADVVSELEQEGLVVSDQARHSITAHCPRTTLQTWINEAEDHSQRDTRTELAGFLKTLIARSHHQPGIGDTLQGQFRRKNLTNIPLTLIHLPAAQQLDFSFNRLTALPDFFANFPYLTQLVLNGNAGLISLPDSLLQCKSVQAVRVAGTAISRQDPVVVQLKERGVKIFF